MLIKIYFYILKISTFQLFDFINFRIFHQRTMLVKGNMSKMSSLNFNNKIEFKSLGLFHTVSIQQAAKKKGKKKK
jgi:hypothetical protein